MLLSKAQSVQLWSASAYAVVAIYLMTTCVHVVSCTDNLRTVYEWKEIDFKYGSDEERWTAIESHEFKPENVIPFGLEVYGSRMFITLPRWRDGVPASLAYIDLAVSDNSIKSPPLIPYPSWEAHSLNESDPELVSPFRVRADRCGRLWVLDARIAGVLENTTLYGPAQLLVYDLHNDNLLRRHVFPANQVRQASFFANLAVEDGDCDNTFVYAADLGAPGLVVYSWNQKESWRAHHNFFHPDPMAGNFSINGIEFQWDDGLYGVSISQAQGDGYSTLYFHPLSSTMEFSVNTMWLRNKTLVTSGNIYHHFKILGSRGTDGQAGASFLDQKTGILFYTLPNQNAVACWKTDNNMYDIKSQGRITGIGVLELVFPSDIKVDIEGRLWVLSNRLQEFIYEELYPATVNFRILMSKVSDVIENTVCEVKTKPVNEIINKLGDLLNTVTSTTTEKSLNAASSYSLTQSTLAAVGVVYALIAAW